MLSIFNRKDSKAPVKSLKPVKRSTKRSAIFVLYKGKSVPLSVAVRATMGRKEDFKTAYMRAFMRVKAGKTGKEVFAPVTN